MSHKVFVVDAHQALRRATLHQREILHRIRIGAELAMVRVHGFRCQPVRIRKLLRIEVARAGEEAVTPTGDEVVAVSLREHEGVVGARRDALESFAGSLVGRLGIRLRRNPRTSREPHAGGGAGDHGTPGQARFQNRVERNPFHGRAC